MKRTVLVAFVFSVACIASSAFAYVSPGKPTGYVSDYTETLSSKTKADLESLLTTFKERGMGEVAVVMVPTLGNDSIENYSLELAREWGIGVKGKDNGVLLLIAKNDHQLRIEVGYGFEGTLTDAKSSRIIREMITPRFKTGQYDDGVSDGVKGILGAIDPTFEGGVSLPDMPDASMNTTKSSIDFPAVIVILYFVASIISLIASILGRSKSWWLGGVLGAGVGGIISYIFAMSILPVVALALVGLFFDFIVSRGYQNSIANGTRPPWWTGGSGGFGGGSSGGFGGFGGGSFGGGGSSGRW